MDEILDAAKKARLERLTMEDTRPGELEWRHSLFMKHVRDELKTNITSHVSIQQVDEMLTIVAKCFLSDFSDVESVPSDAGAKVGAVVMQWVREEARSAQGYV